MSAKSDTIGANTLTIATDLISVSEPDVAIVKVTAFAVVKELRNKPRATIEP
jgi:hypothetical protein